MIFHDDIVGLQGNSWDTMGLSGGTSGDNMGISRNQWESKRHRKMVIMVITC